MLLEVTEDRQGFGDVADGLELAFAHDAVGGGDDDHDVDERRVMADGVHYLHDCWDAGATLSSLTPTGKHATCGHGDEQKARKMARANARRSWWPDTNAVSGDGRSALHDVGLRL